MIGLSSGSVICQKICNAEAPSILADSNGSLGRERIPAKRIRNTNGVHCQMSINIIVGRAMTGSP